ncbi:NIPA-like protein 3 [Mortierella polycephala]|uniref:NIPA-like protein 3 n=1 Tax=Mortierella polycephala TaxID=41804 RepID=A0A9P6PNW2_9FUNG|nr:NIPA-like protein 3 [Mortierella polycephala]
MKVRNLLLSTGLLLVLAPLQLQQAATANAIPTATASIPVVISRQPIFIPPGAGTGSNEKNRLVKRDTPAGMPLTCRSDFDCLQTTRPPNWPREHEKTQAGNYACVFNKESSSSPSTSTGTCQFVVSAGEQCNVSSDCAAFSFYTQFNMTAPSDLCSPQYCTLESTCGSPWQDGNAPANHTYSKTNDGQISCCGGQPTGSICTLVGSNVESCAYHNICKFDFEGHKDYPGDYNDYTIEQMQQQGLGFCQEIDQRDNVWIGVVITLISSTVLNLGLNGQKYALRKHDEGRVRKELEMEEERERWRQELGWTDEQVQAEVDRLYEEKENRRGKIYRRLKPYMFWRAIFVSKLWAAGLLVFILGNLGGFIALRFAPQSLTAPLGSIALISNVIIAPLINKETLGRWDLAGIFFIIAGSVIVVVFSGIVAQDYKLCVLINLFRKPATIAYLALIGIAIVFTFFFIKFVEKNVENEADMAIGVSSEQRLQQEGRLYRIHSNMSNLSLASKHRQELPAHGAHVSTSAASGMEEGRTSKELDSSKAMMNRSRTSLGGSLDAPAQHFVQQPGIPLDSSASHQTMISDTSGTAVGAPPGVETGHSHGQQRHSFSSSHSSNSSKVSASNLDLNNSLKTAVPTGSSAVKQGPHLTFGEPLATTTATNTTTGAGIEAASEERQSGLSQTLPTAPSVHSTNRTIRRRRQHRQSNTHEDGTPLTTWERIRKIELIPSLPEEKLIRRNSPLLRFCLPLSYAALGGMMASYTVLFAKSLINLLVTSIFEGENQFTSFVAWVILIVTVVTAVSQVYWINMGLKKYDALLQVPVFFTIWVLLDIIGGGIYYGEFAGFTDKEYVLFCLGVLIVFFGVALLAKRLAVLAKEDVGEPPSSQAAIAAARKQPTDEEEAPSAAVAVAAAESVSSPLSQKPMSGQDKVE